MSDSNSLRFLPASLSLFVITVFLFKECTLSSSCRPRIEDKLGVCTDEEDIEKDDLPSETSSISEAVDNTVLHASGGHGPDWDYEVHMLYFDQDSIKGMLESPIFQN